MKVFNATRSNSFGITAAHAANLENKVFNLLVTILVKDGKILNAPMSSEYLIAYGVENNRLAVSGRTTKGDEIVASVDIVDGAVDVASIAVQTKEGRINLGKAVFKNPIAASALSLLLPGLLSASWVSFNRLDAEALVIESKQTKITELRTERDRIIASLSGKSEAITIVRTNYRDQITAVEKS